MHWTPWYRSKFSITLKSKDLATCGFQKKSRTNLLKPPDAKPSFGKVTVTSIFKEANSDYVQTACKKTKSLWDAELHPEGLFISLQNGDGMWIPQVQVAWEKLVSWSILQLSYTPLVGCMNACDDVLHTYHTRDSSKKLVPSPCSHWCFNIWAISL